MYDILLYLVTSLLYCALAIYLWQTRWRKPALAGMAMPIRSTVEHHIVLLPLILHIYVLQRSLLIDNDLYLGVGNALSIVVALAVLLYWIGNFFYRLEGLQLLVAPLAALGFLAPLVLPSVHPVQNTGHVMFTLHLLISMVAYGLFTIACLHVAMMALQEKWLHSGASPSVLQYLPPLLTMETLLFRIIVAGFALLTLTVLSGMVFSEELFAQPLRFNHKTLFAIISWCIFAALLGGRIIYGWRGKIAIRWTIAGFLALFLAYFGSKFVIEFILHR